MFSTSLRRSESGLLRFVAFECGLQDLAPSRGCFLEPPRLWDPEAEGWRIQVDVTHRGEASTERTGIYLENLGLKTRRLGRKNGSITLEVYRPRIDKNK